MADATRYGCRTCRRTDLTTTANNALRKHTADGRRRADDNPYCVGTAPVRAETLAQDAPGTAQTAVPAPPNPHRDPLPGGLHENAARAGVAVPPRADQVRPCGCRVGKNFTETCAACRCPGCDHVSHTGVCRQLEMAAPGQIDECGCLDDTEIDPNRIEDPSTAAAAGAVVHTFPSVEPCPFADDGKHVFAFGECGCGYVDPGYVEPKPVLAAKVEIISGADVLMGGTSHNTADADAMDLIMSEDAPSDGSDKLYRNGRYALPDPVTGAKRTWTRATTMAETVSDLYSLNLWRIRMVLIGLARFPDLLDDLQEIDGDGEEGKLDPKIHKDILNKIGFKAQALAGAKVPATWGTEMHTCIERLSRDEITLDEVPEKYNDEVTAWAAAMQEADLSAVPHLIERRIVVPLYGTAGTLDQVDRVHRGRSIRLGNRIVRLNAGDHIVGDVKSGRDLDYGWGEISIQMSIYAQGIRLGKVAVWDPEADEGEGAWTWEDAGIPPKSVRTDVGVVMHVPIGSGTCTLHWIDLEEGWKAVQLCEAVRDWRRVKGLNMPFSIAEVQTSKPPVVRELSWEERFHAVTTKEQARMVYRSYLAAGGDPDSAEAKGFVKIAKTRVAQLTESTA